MGRMLVGGRHPYTKVIRLHKYPFRFVYLFDSPLYATGAMF